MTRVLLKQRKVDTTFLWFKHVHLHDRTLWNDFPGVSWYHDFDLWPLRCPSIAVCVCVLIKHFVLVSNTQQVLGGQATSWALTLNLLHLINSCLTLRERCMCKFERKLLLRCCVCNTDMDNVLSFHFLTMFFKTTYHVLLYITFYTCCIVGYVSDSKLLYTDSSACICNSARSDILPHFISDHILIQRYLELWGFLL